jgi:hypothetical protein
MTQGGGGSQIADCKLKIEYWHLPIDSALTLGSAIDMQQPIFNLQS